MVLKRNPSYFKKGLPYVDELILRDHPRRGQHRRRAPHRADPPRLHRGQQELQPPQGREDADRLPQLAPRLRLPQHQREPRAAQGRPRAPGDQLGGGPQPGHARRRRRLRPPHRAGDRAHEAVAAPRRAVDALLQARHRQGQEAHGRRRRRPPASPSSSCVIPTFPTMVSGAPGRRRPAQAHRHHRGDRERRVRGLDQALARQGLRHDDEHARRATPTPTPRSSARCTRPRARTGTAGACPSSTPCSRRGAAPWTRRSARRSTTASRS